MKGDSDKWTAHGDRSEKIITEYETQIVKLYVSCLGNEVSCLGNEVRR